MTSIIFDFAAIATAMKDDGWLDKPAEKPKKVSFDIETEPCPYGQAPAMQALPPRKRPKGFREILQEAAQGKAKVGDTVRVRTTPLPPASFREIVPPRPRPALRPSAGVDDFMDAVEYMHPIEPNPNAERMMQMQHEMEEMRRRMIEYMHLAISPPRIMLPLRDEDKGSW